MCSRPRSSVQVTVVNAEPGRSGMSLPGPFAVGEQVEPRGGDVGEQRRGPAAAVEAQHRLRGGPDDARSCGSRPRSCPAREGRLGDHDQHRVPGVPVTQVSSVAGPGNFSRATCIFCTCRLPK